MRSGRRHLKQAPLLADDIVRATAEQTVEEAVRRIVPELAEQSIKEELKRLTEDADPLPRSPSFSSSFRALLRPFGP